MKKNKIYDGKTLMMYHISGGGGNNQKLEFVGSKKITDCYDWGSNTFLRDEDCDGNKLPEDEWNLHDVNGHELMDAKELQEALNTGVGRLEFGMDYNTTYTTYLEDLDEDEYLALNNDWKEIYLTVVVGIPEEELPEIVEENGISTLFDYQYKNTAPKEEQIRKSIGKVLKNHREKSGISIWKVAQASDTHTDNIKAVEEGETNYTINSLIKYLCGCDVQLHFESKNQKTELEKVDM